MRAQIRSAMSSQGAAGQASGSAQSSPRLQKPADSAGAGAGAGGSGGRGSIWSTIGSSKSEPGASKLQPSAPAKHRVSCGQVIIATAGATARRHRHRRHLRAEEEGVGALPGVGAQANPPAACPHVRGPRCALRVAALSPARTQAAPPSGSPAMGDTFPAPVRATPPRAVPPAVCAVSERRLLRHDQNGRAGDFWRGVESQS